MFKEADVEIPGGGVRHVIPGNNIYLKMVLQHQEQKDSFGTCLTAAIKAVS